MTGKSLIGGVSAIRLFVHDIEAAEAFYTGRLGLALSVAAPDCLIYEIGGVQLIVETIDADDKAHADYVGRFTGLSFNVEDCAAAHNRLSAAGVAFDCAPTIQDWGGILAHFRDPDGNVLTLVQPP